MRVRETDARELVATSTFEARLDLASLEDANVLTGYECDCRKCVG